MNERNKDEQSPSQQSGSVEAFINGMIGEINSADVSKMMLLQQHMMSRFEKTNEMLLNFNRLSDARYETTQNDFRKHLQLLQQTKNDLDIVFRRIRALRDKLSSRYPTAFKACSHVHLVPDDEPMSNDADINSTPTPADTNDTCPTIDTCITPTPADTNDTCPTVDTDTCSNSTQHTCPANTTNDLTTTPVDIIVTDASH